MHVTCRRGGWRRHSNQKAKDRSQRKLVVGVDIPSPDEIRAIIAALDGRWRPLILTAIFCGLRASELRGLRWADVDLKDKELHVRKRADRYNALGNPKSAAGQRRIPLPPLLLNVLKEHKLASLHPLVFPNGAGNVENYSNIMKRGFQPAQIRAGVSVPVLKDGRPVLDDNGNPLHRAKYGMHALRHFFASWCINRKVDGGLELPLKVVQARMGHASITMTADTYGHLFPRSDDGAELAAAERALVG